MITPILFLTVLFGISTVAVIVHLIRRQFRCARLRHLAARWQMHYTTGDRFGLSDRVGEHLDVVGASNVRVQDVIYGTEGDNYRYFFTALYTTGVLRRKLDERVICTITECRQRQSALAGELGTINKAPDNLGLVDQYIELKRGLSDKHLLDSAAQQKERIA